MTPTDIAKAAVIEAGYPHLAKNFRQDKDDTEFKLPWVKLCNIKEDERKVMLKAAILAHQAIHPECYLDTNCSNGQDEGHIHCKTCVESDYLSHIKHHFGRDCE